MDQQQATVLPHKQTARGVRDTFVMIAMALVSAALGLGLYMQLALSSGLALLVALTALVALLTMHVVVRRDQIVAELGAEVEALKTQIAELSKALPQRAAAGPAELRSQPPPLPAPAKAAAPAAPAGQRTDAAAAMPGPARDGKPAAWAAPPPLSKAPAVPASAAADVRPGAAEPRLEAETRTRPLAASPPTPGPALAASPPAAAAFSTAIAARILREEAAGARSATAAGQIAAPQRAGSSSPAAAGPVRPAPLGGAMPAPSTEPTMAPYWALRPGAQREPELPLPAERQARLPDGAATADKAARVAAAPALAKSPAATPARPEPSAAPSHAAPIASTAPGKEAEHALLPPAAAQSSRSAGASTGSMAPAAEHEATPDAPPTLAENAEGTDHRAMQQLIQQLAVRLNAPAEREPALPPRHAVAARPDEEAAIVASVSALRQTAESMRRPGPESGTPVSPTCGATEDTEAAAGVALEATAERTSSYALLASAAEALAAGRADLYLEPILGLEDRKARHFEVSVRLRTDDDAVLAPQDYGPVLAGTGLLARLDAAKLMRTADVAGRLTQRGTSASLFANVSGESLADNSFLDAFADTFIDRQPMCARLVLSFAQADVRGFADVHWEALATMTELGFRFALEEVTDLDMDFEDLKSAGFEFVKLDAAVFLEGMPSGEDVIPSADICRHLAELGLGLIIGGIADEAVVARIIGFGVLLGQGTLFGAPRPVKVEAPRSAAA